MIMADKNSNGTQFSKLTTVLCIIVALICIFLAPTLVISFELPETVAGAIIAAGGTLGATAVVANLKKAQAENTMKIYLSAYKTIADIKKENGEDVNEFLANSEEDIINKLNSSLSNNLEDATEIIEKQDLI